MVRDRTVRFWIWENGGPVRLSLRSTGRAEVRWTTGHSHEEGYYSEASQWVLSLGELPHDDVVYHEFSSYDSDCDGPLERHGLYSCSAALLAAGNECEDDRTPEGKPIIYPLWQRVSTEQRDHFAEAAGY